MKYSRRLRSLREKLKLFSRTIASWNTLRHRVRDLQRKLKIRDEQHANQILHHYPMRLSGKVDVVSSVASVDDRKLVSRVVAAYRKAVKTPVGATDSIWLHQFARAKRDTQQLLDSEDHEAIARSLRNPSSSMLFFGFDLIQSKDVPRNNVPWWPYWQHQLTYDSLLQTMRAIGIGRIENPEAGITFDEAPDVESILEKLDAAFGFRIEFPNVFVGEIGLVTSRGIANYRAIQALYQAWRIKQMIRDVREPHVLEIGAGLGRTAYFAMKMGVRSYTIIDLPLTGVAQGYFLGRVLGEESVSLWDEKSERALLHILPPVAFEQGNARFDLIINVDSITEMAESTAREYFEMARKRTSRFLSINHEHNTFTMADIYRDREDIRVWRSPYWLRRGYVEELITFL